MSEGITQAASIDELIDLVRRRWLTGERSGSHVQHGVRALRAIARACSWQSAADITEDSILRYLEAQQAARRSAKTRNTQRSYIAQLCAAAKGRGLVGDPMAGVPVAKVVRRMSRVVPTEDQVRALIQAAAADPRKKDRALVYLIAATAGLRWECLKGLEWQHVHETANPPRLQLPAHLVKGREPKVIWLTHEAAEALAAHRRATADRGLEGRVLGYGHERQRRVGRYVFRGVPKYEGFVRDCREAGIPTESEDGRTFSFHSLRHFASNRGKWLGLSDAERCKQNGHKGLRVTTDVYTDPEAAELGRRVYGLPGLLLGNDPPRGKAHDDLTQGTGVGHDSEPRPMQTAAPHHQDSRSPAANGPVVATSAAQPSAIPSPQNVSADPALAEPVVPVGVGGFESPSPSQNMQARALALAERALALAERVLAAAGSPTRSPHAESPLGQVGGGESR